MGGSGVVRFWSGDDGWGVIDAPATPGGCWAGFADLASDSFWEPREGERVELEWERVEQDGYHFRATRIWPFGASPAVEEPPELPDDAFHSSLTIEYN